MTDAADVLAQERPRAEDQARALVAVVIAAAIALALRSAALISAANPLRR